MANSAVQKKKKFNWKPWAALLVIALFAGYVCSGIFTFDDLNIENLSQYLGYVFMHPFNNWFNEKTGVCILISLMVWMFAMTYFLASMKNYMPGKEMGSAEWAEPAAFNKSLSAKDEKADNMVLSLNTRKSYDTKKTLLNNNVTVVGGSGSGKTAGFVGPNILQFHGSAVYTDPKGDTLKDFGPALIDAGYRVEVINLTDMKKSHRYNPFKYIRTQGDLTKLITNLIANTTPADATKGDPFWDKAETLYLTALFAYVWYECGDDAVYHKYAQVSIRDPDAAKRELAGCTDVTDVSLQRTMKIVRGTVTDENGTAKKMPKTIRTVLRLLDEAAVSDDENKMSNLDCRMEALRLRLIEEGKNPDNHPALKNYYRAIRGAGDTVRSIIISANARFAPFDNELLLNILDDDDIDLPSLGVGANGDMETKTALFCVLPDDDTTWNFVPGMLYTQMFQELYRVARKYGNKLPIEVGFWFDEFANIKMPNNFEKILATCRSRNVYIVIILQSLAQIKTLYKDQWEGLIGNCDTLVYLGGNEQSSHKYFSEVLGKWTIDKRSHGETLGSHGSTSRNYDILGRELLTPDEIKNMPNEDSIVLVRGQNPVYDRKMYWFKQTEWNHIKDMDDYRFEPIIKPFLSFVNKKSYKYIKGDDEKAIKEVACGSIANVLKYEAFDSQKNNCEEKENVEQGLTNGKYEAYEPVAQEQLENMSITEVAVHAEPEEDQAEAIRSALEEGLPMKAVKNLINKRASADEIYSYIEMYNTFNASDEAKGKAE